MIRLFVLCISIGIIPVVTIGIFSYYKSSTTVIEKVTVGNMESLKQTQFSLEQLLLGIDNSMTQFINTSLVNTLINQDLDILDFQQIELLSRGTYQLQTFHLGIQNIYFVNSRYNWMISNRGFERFNEWENSDHWASILEGRGTSFWLSFQNLKQYPFTNDRDIPSNSIFMMKKLPIHSISPLGFVLVVIPGYELEKFLSKTSPMNTITILDDEHRLLISHGLNEEDFRYLNFTENLQKINANLGSFTINTNSGNQLVSFRKSAYNGWTYISTTPMKDIKRDSNAIGMFTIFVCVVTLLVTIFISYFGSRQISLPIRLLHEDIVERTKGFFRNRDNDRASGNEIEQISTRISNILSLQSELSYKIQGQTNQLKENFVINLLKGEIRHKEVAEQLEWFGFSNNWNLFSVIAVEIHSLDHSRYEPKDKDLLMFAIKNFSEELFTSSERLNPVLMNQMVIITFGCSDGNTTLWNKRILDHSELLRRMLADVMELPVNIGISKPFHKFIEAHNAFKEASEVLKYRIRFEEDAIFDSNVILPSKRKIRGLYPEFVTTQILEAIRLGDLNRTQLLFKSFMQEVLKEEVNYEEYQFVLIRLFIEIIRELENQGDYSLSMLFGETSWIEQFLKLKSANDYELWFSNHVIGPVIQILEDRIKHKHQSISQKVKDIIHDEFAKDLTLEFCAARLNYNPSYIRQVFFKETGHNFSTYLAEHRLNMAKLWLINSDLKIADIADKLGYNNAQNFIRSFRKMEGLTPGSFRERHR